jgi:hypothetical protein
MRIARRSGKTGEMLDKWIRTTDEEAEKKISDGWWYR